MSYSLTHVSSSEKEETFLNPRNREIISVLMDSPFYFFLPVEERKEIVKRITHLLLINHKEVK